MTTSGLLSEAPNVPSNSSKTLLDKCGALALGGNMRKKRDVFCRGPKTLSDSTNCRLQEPLTRIMIIVTHHDKTSFTNFI